MRNPFDLNAYRETEYTDSEMEEYGLPYSGKAPPATIDMSSRLEEIDRKMLPAKLFAAGISLDRARKDFTEIQEKYRPLLENPHRAVNIQELKDYEREFGHCEDRYVKAKKAYAALLELLTGDRAERIEERLAA